MSVSSPVVSNAGPLVAMAKLSLLHLLKELYGRVYFSRSVYDEAVTEGTRQGYQDARTLLLFLEQMNWSPQSVDPAAIPADLLEVRLDRGERDTVNRLRKTICHSDCSLHAIAPGYGLEPECFINQCTPPGTARL